MRVQSQTSQTSTDTNIQTQAHQRIISTGKIRSNSPHIKIYRIQCLEAELQSKKIRREKTLREQSK